MHSFMFLCIYVCLYIMHPRRHLYVIYIYVYNACMNLCMFNYVYVCVYIFMCFRRIIYLYVHVCKD